MIPLDCNCISIDRIENGVASCELPDRTIVQVSLDSLPEGVGEGDCLQRVDNGYVIDMDETLRRRNKNKKLLDLLKRGNNFSEGS